MANNFRRHLLAAFPGLPAFATGAGGSTTFLSKAGNDTAATNEILSRQFPELINAVKGLNPNWRRADSPT